MTNLEIVIKEIQDNKIFTEEQLQAFIQEGDIPLKTYMAWRQSGFSIRKGEKACLTTKLWQKKRKKKNEDEKEEKDKEDKMEYVLVTAHLFRGDQVVKIGKEVSA